MKLVRLIDFLRDRLRKVIVVSLVLLGLLVVLDAIPAAVDKQHAHTKLEQLPGFWTIFGFLACVLIVVVSKAYGKTGVMTREDYYDE